MNLYYLGAFAFCACAWLVIVLLAIRIYEVVA